MNVYGLAVLGLCIGLLLTQFRFHVDDPSVHARTTIPSIAVLPFDNLSGDPGDERFSDGLSENVISALSRIRQGLVIARNATFRYKGQAVLPSTVGRELNVDYMLEGSLQRDGNRIRITAQLVETATGNHLLLVKLRRNRP